MNFEQVNLASNHRLIPEGLFSGFSRNPSSDPFKILEDENLSFEDILNGLGPLGTVPELDLNRSVNGENRHESAKTKTFFQGEFR